MFHEDLQSLLTPLSRPRPQARSTRRRRLAKRPVPEQRGALSSTARDRFGALKATPLHIESVLRELNGVSWEVGRHNEDGVNFYVNVSLYDVADDRLQLPGSFPTLPCALVQVRYFAPELVDSGGFNAILKNYALVGRNEDGSAYSHPVSCYVRRTDTTIGAMCGKAQGWIFGIRSRLKDKDAVLQQMWRQGDVALSPLELSEGRRSPFEAPLDIAETKRPDGPVQVMDTHWLEACSEVMVDDSGEAVAARDPVLVHRRGEHMPLALKGVYRIHRGRREEWHEHSVETLD